MNRRADRWSSVTGNLSAAVFACVALFGPTALARGDARDIDTARSGVTVYVYKSGLFAAFADNHIIKAPIATGSLSEDSPLAISLTIRSNDLRVVDPDLPADRRAEVQARMLGAEVLDASRFPDITFASTAIVAAGANRWHVTGALTIRGRTRPVTFLVVGSDGAYRGDVVVSQRDFGIQPITIAGGTVKVKDEIKVSFDIRR